MTDPQITQLDPSLASLLEAERGRTNAPAGSKDAAYGRILAKLARGAAIGAAGGATAKHLATGAVVSGAKSGGAGAVTLGKSVPALLLAFAVGAASGSIATVVVLHRGANVPTPAAAASSASSQPGVPTAASSSPEPRAAAGQPIAGTAAPQQAEATPTSPPGDRTLADERRILDRAQLALARGDSSTAIGAAEEHRARFPAGQLEVEREAILIQALVVAHRGDEARARAMQFRARYPNSVFWRVVKRAVGDDPNK